MYNRFISKDEAFLFTGYSKTLYKWDYIIVAIITASPISSNKFQKHF